MVKKKTPQENRPKGSSLAGTGKARRKPKPSSKSRTKKQTTRDRYAHAREDAQLTGVIPTTPEEALKSEVVDSTSQGDGAPALTASLVAMAIRRGWAVSPECAARYIDILDGIMEDPSVPAKVKVAAFQALRMADQAQWERDHPEQAGKTKGGTTVNNTNNVQNNNTIVTGDVFGDIDRTIQAIEGREQQPRQVVIEAASNLSADGAEQPVPEAQPNNAEAQSETNRLSDGDGL